MGWVLSCCRARGYERLDPEATGAQPTSSLANDLGVPPEDEVLAAVEDDDIDLSDTELAMYMTTLETK
jgi:hypothetical protein